MKKVAKKDRIPTKAEYEAEVRNLSAKYVKVKVRRQVVEFHDFFLEGKLMLTIRVSEGKLSLQHPSNQWDPDGASTLLWHKLHEWCDAHGFERLPLPGTIEGLGFTW